LGKLKYAITLILLLSCATKEKKDLWLEGCITGSYILMKGINKDIPYENAFIYCSNVKSSIDFFQSDKSNADNVEKTLDL
jgi:hypothetical protein